MQFIILLTSLIAAISALPIAQVGTGAGDVLSGGAGGTNSLLAGGANNLVNNGGNSAADLSSSGGKLVNRSPQVGAGTGDFLSGTAGGLNAVLSGGANNLVNSAGNSVADLANSGGNLINRSPEPQAGVSSAICSNTIEVSRPDHASTGWSRWCTTRKCRWFDARRCEQLSHQWKNAWVWILELGWWPCNSLTRTSSRCKSHKSAQALYKHDELTIIQQAGSGDLLSGTAGGTNTLMAGGANNFLNNGGNSAADVSSSAGKMINWGTSKAVVADMRGKLYSQAWRITLWSYMVRPPTSFLVSRCMFWTTNFFW
jgi:hypothetical protein